MEAGSRGDGLASTELSKEWTKYGMDILEKDHLLSLSLQSVEAAVESMDMRNSA